MPSPMTTVDGFPIPVEVAGPQGSPVVVVLSAAQRTTASYEAICQRLHTAHLRTVVIGPDERLGAKSVVGIMDALDIQWRSEEHTSELQSRGHLVCRLLLEKKNRKREKLDYADSRGHGAGRE